MSDQKPRIAPGTPAEIGRVNYGIARVIGAATGGRPPNVFTTLARHKRLFRKWLRFAGALMPGGVLPRVDTELLILRTAHNCGSDYEWDQHERLGKQAGLSAEQIERVREGPGAEGWSDREALFLRAADELHADRSLSDETYERLRSELNEVELIEFCMLVGHYEMLGMTLNSLRVENDRPPSKRPPRAMRALARRRLGGD